MNRSSGVVGADETIALILISVRLLYLAPHSEVVPSRLQDLVLQLHFRHLYLLLVRVAVVLPRVCFEYLLAIQGPHNSNPFLSTLIDSFDDAILLVHTRVNAYHLLLSVQREVALFVVDGLLTEGCLSLVADENRITIVLGTRTHLGV